jgi:hypothetical protein
MNPFFVEHPNVAMMQYQQCQFEWQQWQQWKQWQQWQQWQQQLKNNFHHVSPQSKIEEQQKQINKLLVEQQNMQKILDAHNLIPKQEPKKEEFKKVEKKRKNNEDKIDFALVHKKIKYEKKSFIESQLFHDCCTNYKNFLKAAVDIICAEEKYGILNFSSIGYRIKNCWFSPVQKKWNANGKLIFPSLTMEKDSHCIGHVIHYGILLENGSRDPNTWKFLPNSEHPFRDVQRYALQEKGAYLFDTSNSTKDPTIRLCLHISNIVPYIVNKRVTPHGLNNIPNVPLEKEAILFLAKNRHNYKILCPTNEAKNIISGNFNINRFNRFFSKNEKAEESKEKKESEGFIFLDFEDKHENKESKGEQMSHEKVKKIIETVKRKNLAKNNTTIIICYEDEDIDLNDCFE